MQSLSMRGRTVGLGRLPISQTARYANRFRATVAGS